MLDEDLHNSLPEADVAAFCKAELIRCVDAVRRVRLVERMDGSLTTEKTRRNLLETAVLPGIVEDGLREEMAPDRLARLDAEDRSIAREIQMELFQEFISPGFNAEVQLRARAGSALSQMDVLQLRWAAVEARMAAHEAALAVPLHNGDRARVAAVSLLKQIMQEATGDHDRDDGIKRPQQGRTTRDEIAANPVPSVRKASEPPVVSAPVLTPGVSRIEGRMTGRAVLAQFEAAKAQPRDEVFDGTADTAVIERTYGSDIAGTAVRMTWRSNANKDTRAQKLKSAILFMFLTGVQQVSEIRQHHLDQFSKLIRKKMREPRRVCRRLIVVSYAAMFSDSRAA